MIRAGHRLRQSILVLGDLVIFTLALALTLWIRYGNVSEAISSHAWPFGIVMALWVIGFYIAGLYDSSWLRDALKLFRVYLEGMLANGAIAVAFFYLVPLFGIAPRTNLFLFFALSLCLGYAWRLVYYRSIGPRVQHRRVVFVGPPSEAAVVHRLLTASGPGLGMAAVFPTDTGARPTLPVVWLDTASALLAFLDKEPHAVIVLGVKPDLFPELKQMLYQTLFRSVTLIDRAEIEEFSTGRIPLSYVNESWFLHHLNEPDKAWFEWAKRALDLTLALPLALATVIIFPVISLLIKVSSPGPVLYTQERVGKNGARIFIRKFRTMRMDAEVDGPAFTASAKTDPRLFAVGRWLRRLRIDEFPQVWNVLCGDLSFVGPRPERPEFVTPLIERMPYYQLRHLAKPGLTGWAQIRYLTPIAQLDDNLVKLQYDLYYIKNRSLLLDGAILLKTIGIIVRRQGT